MSLGLSGVRLVISDDHAGLKAARRSIFGGIPWQRCQFQLSLSVQQNAGQHVPRQTMKAKVAAGIREIFNASDHTTAETNLAKTVRKYAKIASKLADWLEQNIPEGLPVFAFPAVHQRRLRTTNVVGRLNREIHRRSSVVSILPNQPSCLRLNSAVLVEQDEEWQVHKRANLTIYEKGMPPLQS